MEHLYVRMTPDEAKYVMHHLERRKDVVSRSEILDLDDIIRIIQKAVDEFTVELLYKDLEKLRVLGG